MSFKRRLDNARLAQLQITYEKYVRGEVERYISEVLPSEEYTGTTQIAAILYVKGEVS